MKEKQRKIEQLVQKELPHLTPEAMNSVVKSRLANLNGTDTTKLITADLGNPVTLYELTVIVDKSATETEIMEIVNQTVKQESLEQEWMTDYTIKKLNNVKQLANNKTQHNFKVVKK